MAVQKLLSDVWSNGTVTAKLPPYPRALRSGCWVCHKFIAWVELNYQELLRGWRGTPMDVAFAISAEFGFFGTPHQDQPLLPCELGIAPEGLGNECPVLLGFVSHQDLSPYLFTGLPDQDPMMRISNFVKPWLNRCSKTHSKCRQKQSGSWYPTRLIRLVSGDQGIAAKLIITEDAAVRGRYMTLSHRWPAHPGRYLMLTSSTLAQLQHGIDIQRLPRSFRETMELACHLRIKYLWIDSLCIRQDSDDLSDWEREALTMHKVYAHSFLNVSASFSRDGEESLFYRAKTWAATRPPQIEVPVNGHAREVYVVDGEFWNGEITDAPLNQRGWVFQERFLAPRVLHFGRSQLGWECCEAEALETFPNGIPFSLVAGSNSKSTMLRGLSRISGLDSTPSDATTMKMPSKKEISLIEWRGRLIEEYSKCEITYAKDKLIAFLGVAKSEIMAPQPSDQYIAGMWKSSLVFDLAWQRVYNETPLPRVPQNPNFRAPRWSWASFGGEVSFPSRSIALLSPLFAEIKDVCDDPLWSGSRPSPRQGDLPISESYIDLECFLFTSNLIWSPNDDVSGITLNEFGITFMTEGAENQDNPHETEKGLPGTFVDLSEDPTVPEEQSLKRLAEAQGLFLVPLFATRYSLEAMVVAQLGHEPGIYCRMGGVSIALHSQQGMPTPGMATQESGELPWIVNMPGEALRLYMVECPRQPTETGDYRRIRIT